MEHGMEIELKLQVAARSAWDALAAFVRARGEAAPPLEMEALYFDTPQADLRRARLAYRVRREGTRWVATLKGGGSSAGGLHRRSEWNRPAAGAQPDLSLFADVLDGSAALSAAELRPVVRTIFVRQAVLVQCEGATLEAALDCGAIEAGGRSAPILEVELELKAGRLAGALQFGAELAQRFPLVLESRSKFLRGLLLAGLAQESAAPPAAPATAQQALLSLAAQLRDAWAAGRRPDARGCLRCLDALTPLARRDAALGEALAVWRARLAEGGGETGGLLAVLLRVWKEIAEEADA